MSERDGRSETDDAGTNTDEGATPGRRVGALDGVAAAGSVGAVGADKPQSAMPQEAPDPSTGPD